MINYDLIDLREELEQYEWHNAKWSAMKLIAASPFRYDRSPSFYVWLDGDDKGAWGDSGGDDEYRKGGLIKLLSFLREETTEETEEYLEERYGVREIREGDEIKIPTITIQERKPRVVLSNYLFSEHTREYSYLESRGIPIEVQQMFDIWYDPKRKAVAIPWRYADGRLANVKYRHTTSKLFWYVEDGEAIRTIVFGLDLIYSGGHKKVYVCEAEIDAMTLWTRGLPAVAVGSGSMSPEQKELILKSPIESLVIAVDNDEQGGRLATHIKRELGADIAISKVSWAPYKDANEYHRKKLENSC